VNIAINDIPLKTRFFGPHFTRRTYRCILNHFYIMGAESYRVWQNNASQTTWALRHSRPPILVPIERPYVTSC